MHLYPFAAWRPTVATAAQVSSVPYDVVDRDEAAALARGNPLSFLRVTRAEIDLPDGTPPDSPDVYAHARERFQALQQRGTLIRERAPALYLYRQERAGRAQRGLVACCRTDDYTAGRIVRHEKTRPDKEDDRARHILELRAHTGLVFLVYRDDPGVDALVAAEEARPPLYDFTAADGVRHTVWQLPTAAPMCSAFAAVPKVYIADGHHRAAAAVRVAAQLRAKAPSAAAGCDPAGRFPAVLVPASQVAILPYHRCVRDLHGHSEMELLSAIQRRVALVGNACPTPPGPGHACMHLGGRWYQLHWPQAAVSQLDPVSALDASMLQDTILEPLLGIEDPRRDTRIEFVGGIHGPEALERRVAEGRAAVAFTLPAVRVEQILSVADAGACMPPKSTWFEPKLRDGLLVHAF